MRLKLKAQESGAESIVRTGDKITLQFPHEVSSVSTILAKLLGYRWTIGNKQIRTTIDGLGDDWENQLIDAVDKLSDFQRNMTARFEEASEGDFQRSTL